MPEHLAFFLISVQPAEQMLLQHDLAGLFTGALFREDDEPLASLRVEGLGADALNLSAQEVGRLCMAPDESVVVVRQVREQADGSPAGLSVQSDNLFVQPDQPIEVIVYRGENGGALLVRNLHIRTLMLEHSAPDRFATVGFGLMAVTAYRREFSEITLFAAGRGPVKADGNPPIFRAC